MFLRPKRVILAIACLILFHISHLAFAAGFLMKGPDKPEFDRRATRQVLETSCIKLAFGGAIKFFQKRISPIDGDDRCGFWPPCSAYGYQCVSEQGPLVGLMMIGDRLIRCNIWKKPGPDYTLLPTGKLYDPPSQNIVHEFR